MNEPENAFAIPSKASLWLAGFGLLLGPITLVPAIALGHRARRGSGPATADFERATVALWLAYAFLVADVLAVLAYWCLSASRVEIQPFVHASF